MSRRYVVQEIFDRHPHLALQALTISGPVKGGWGASLGHKRRIQTQLWASPSHAMTALLRMREVHPGVKL